LKLEKKDVGSEFEKMWGKALFNEDVDAEDEEIICVFRSK